MPNAQRTGTQILVVADDFTGANDAGVGLSLNGVRVSVIFDVNKLSAGAAGNALVINTDSRAASAEVAAQRTAAAIGAWRSLGGKGRIFKKIDSTLRGNIGAETAAALLAAQSPMALIAPAAPALGRVTRGGQVWVNDRLLTETEFASDPKTPVFSAAVGARLAEQSDLPVAEVPLAQVRQADLARYLGKLADEGIRLAVLDAEHQRDLENIILAAEALPFSPLLVGSAGLSEALAKQIGAQPPVDKPLLAIIGSMSDIAQKQIAFVSRRKNVALVDIDINTLFTASAPAAMERWRRAALTALACGRHCIIRTCHSGNQRFDIDRLCQRHRLSRQQLGETISRSLGELCRNIVLSENIFPDDGGISRRPPGGLYLSGGDIAIAAATALGASGFQIKGRIASCVPWGRLLDSALGDLPVMTKAGGFGNEATLLDVLRFIEEKVSE
ncbi:four-carbon acid sugar kinase family protein [Brenneria populi subsp. brevivirga]|uniref:D-threonate kinase n=1 Tax=Brenneria populi TaxID=1505588 RepID=UPI002E19A404|nr:four-carbon acid sugar kinase family protein [Brenneria populi subsp. brevivirga]